MYYDPERKKWVDKHRNLSRLRAPPESIPLSPWLVDAVVETQIHSAPQNLTTGKEMGPVQEAGEKVDSPLQS
jgi:hypothetical protein